MSTSINNAMNTSNITIEIPGVGMVSPASYAEFYKLREAYENGKDIFSWEYNPYFFVALYSYYRAMGKKTKATGMKNTILNGWYLDNFHGITVGYLSKGDEFSVEIETVSPDGYFENRIYKDAAG